MIGMVVITSIAGSAYLFNDKKPEMVDRGEKNPITAYEIQKVNLSSASCESAPELKDSKKISAKPFSYGTISPIKEAEASKFWSDTLIASR